MNLLTGIINRVVRYRYKQLQRGLRAVDHDGWRQRADKAAIDAFRDAARRVPAYAQLLRQRGIDPNHVVTAEEFCRLVPVVDKETVFPQNDLKNLCVGGHLDDVRLFYSSSGHSGIFSFGLETWADARSSALALEFILQDRFGALDRRTMVINALSMGVKIHTRTLPLAETSVREDVIWGLLKKLRGEFKQFILIGEALFLKQVVEGGVQAGVDWPGMRVHLVTGGEYIAQTYREHLERLLGIDPRREDAALVGVSFGLSELGTSLMSETAQTITLRRHLVNDKPLAAELGLPDVGFIPPIMPYIPTYTYCEAVPADDGRNELVVTMLQPGRKLPLIRYNTHDTVHLLSRKHAQAVLAAKGLQHLLPPDALPLAMPMGKLASLPAGDGKQIYPETVKEALYESADVALATTGRFRLIDGGQLLLQLKPNQTWPASHEQALRESLAKRDLGNVSIQPTPCEQFPGSMTLDYERKCKYV
ncbi:MAG: hypothetical protein FWE88_02690 [Phycisphaerae bacterium]|nr:hypothetical protein [Phycisphaerae bacterium]